MHRYHGGHLYIKQQNNDFNDESEYFFKKMHQAETHLRNFLLGNISNLDQYEQHIFPLSEIEKLPESKYMKQL